MDMKLMLLYFNFQFLRYSFTSILDVKLMAYWDTQNTVEKPFFWQGFPTRNLAKILESYNLRNTFRVFSESQKDRRKANF